MAGEDISQLGFRIDTATAVSQINSFIKDLHRVGEAAEKVQGMLSFDLSKAFDGIKDIQDTASEIEVDVKTDKAEKKTQKVKAKVEDLTQVMINADHVFRNVFSAAANNANNPFDAYIEKNRDALLGFIDVLKQTKTAWEALGSGKNKDKQLTELQQYASSLQKILSTPFSEKSKRGTWLGFDLTEGNQQLEDLSWAAYRGQKAHTSLATAFESAGKAYSKLQKAFGQNSSSTEAVVANAAEQARAAQNKARTLSLNVAAKLIIDKIESVTISDEAKNSIRKNAQNELVATLSDLHVSLPQTSPVMLDSATFSTEMSFETIEKEVREAILEKIGGDKGVKPINLGTLPVSVFAKPIALDENGNKLTFAYISSKIQSQLQKQSEETGGIRLDLPLNMNIGNGELSKSFDGIKLSLTSAIKGNAAEVQDATLPLKENMVMSLEDAARAIEQKQQELTASISEKISGELDNLVARLDSKAKNISARIGKGFKDIFSAAALDDDRKLQIRESVGYVASIIKELNKAPEALEGKASAVAEFFSNIGWAGQQASNLSNIVNLMRDLSKVDEIKSPKLKPIDLEAAETWAIDSVSNLQSEMDKTSVSVGVTFDGQTGVFVDSVTNGLRNISIPLDDGNITIGGKDWGVDFDNEDEFRNSLGKKIKEALGKGLVLSPKIALSQKSPNIQFNPETTVKIVRERLENVGFEASPVITIKPDYAHIDAIGLANVLSNDITQQGGLNLTPKIYVFNSDTQFSAQALQNRMAALVDAVKGVKLSPQITVDSSNATINVNALERQLESQMQKGITLNTQVNIKGRGKIQIDAATKQLLDSALNTSVSQQTLDGLQKYAQYIQQIALSYVQLGKSGVSPHDLHEKVADPAIKDKVFNELYKTGQAAGRLETDLFITPVIPPKGTRAVWEAFYEAGNEIRKRNPQLVDFFTGSSIESIFSEARSGMDSVKPSTKVAQEFLDANKGMADFVVKAGKAADESLRKAQTRLKDIKRETQALRLRTSNEEKSNYENITTGLLGRTRARSEKEFEDLKNSGQDLFESLSREAGIGRVAVKDWNDEFSRIKDNISEINARRIKLNLSGMNTDALKKFQIELHDTGNAYINFLNTMGIYVSARGIVNWLKSATQAASNFNIEIRRIQSLAEDMDFSRLRNGLLGIDAVYGNVLNNAKALYWAYSSGVRGTEKDMVDFTKEMAKTARTINADVMSTTDAITNMMNAYGYSVKDAKMLGDVLFTIVKEGKANAQQLTASFGNVIATASALGITEKELGAATATLTKTMSANKALTIFNNIISKMINPSNEAAEEMQRLGLDISATAVKAKGFTQVMKELRAATQGNIGLVTKLFPDLRGQRAALTLLSTQWKDFERQLAKQEQSAGNRDEALKSLTETPEAALDAWKNTVSALKTETGDALISIVTLGGMITPLIDKVNKLGAAGKGVIGWAGALAGVGFGLNFISKGMTLLDYTVGTASVQRANMSIELEINSLVAQRSEIEAAMLSKQEEAALKSQEAAQKEKDAKLDELKLEEDLAQIVKERAQNDLAAVREKYKGEADIFKLERQRAINLLEKKRSEADAASLNIYDLSKLEKDGDKITKNDFDTLVAQLEQRIEANEQIVSMAKTLDNAEKTRGFDEQMQLIMAKLGREAADGVEDFDEAVKEYAKELSAYIKSDDAEMAEHIASKKIENEILRTWIQNAKQAYGNDKFGDVSRDAIAYVMRTMERERAVSLHGYEAERSEVSQGAGVAWAGDEKRAGLADEIREKLGAAVMTVNKASKNLTDIKLAKINRQAEIGLERAKLDMENAKANAKAIKAFLDRATAEIDAIRANSDARLRSAYAQGGASAMEKEQAKIQKEIRDKIVEIKQQMQSSGIKVAGENGAINGINGMAAIAKMSGMPLALSSFYGVPFLGNITRALTTAVIPLKFAVSGVTLPILKFHGALKGLESPAKNAAIATVAQANAWKYLKAVFTRNGAAMNELAKTAGMASTQFSALSGSLMAVGGIAAAVIGAGIGLYAELKHNWLSKQLTDEDNMLAKLFNWRTGFIDAAKKRDDIDYRNTRYEEDKAFNQEYIERGNRVLAHLDAELDMARLRNDTENEIVNALKMQKKAIEESIDVLGKSDVENAKLAPQQAKELSKAEKELGKIENYYKEIRLMRERTKPAEQLDREKDILSKYLGREATDKDIEHYFYDEQLIIKQAREEVAARNKALKEAITGEQTKRQTDIATKEFGLTIQNIRDSVLDMGLSSDKKYRNKKIAYEENRNNLAKLLGGKTQDEVIGEKETAMLQARARLNAAKDALAKDKENKELQKSEEEAAKAFETAKSDLEKTRSSLLSLEQAGVSLAKELKTLREDVEKDKRAMSDARIRRDMMMTNNPSGASELDLLKSAYEFAKSRRENAVVDIKADSLRVLQSDVERTRASRNAFVSNGGLMNSPEGKRLADAVKAAEEELAKAEKDLTPEKIMQSKAYADRMNEETSAMKNLADKMAQLNDTATKLIKDAAKDEWNVLTQRILNGGKGGVSEYLREFSTGNSERRKAFSEGNVGGTIANIREMFGMIGDDALTAAMEGLLDGTVTFDQLSNRFRSAMGDARKNIGDAAKSLKESKDDMFTTGREVARMSGVVRKSKERLSSKELFQELFTDYVDGIAASQENARQLALDEQRKQEQERRRQDEEIIRQGIENDGRLSYVKGMEWSERKEELSRMLKIARGGDSAKRDALLYQNNPGLGRRLMDAREAVREKQWLLKGAYAAYRSSGASSGDDEERKDIYKEAIKRSKTALEKSQQELSSAQKLTEEWYKYIFVPDLEDEYTKVSAQLADFRKEEAKRRKEQLEKRKQQQKDERNADIALENAYKTSKQIDKIDKEMSEKYGRSWEEYAQSQKADNEIFEAAAKVDDLRGRLNDYNLEAYRLYKKTAMAPHVEKVEQAAKRVKDLDEIIKGREDVLAGQIMTFEDVSETTQKSMAEEMADYAEHTSKLYLERDKAYQEWKKAYENFKKADNPESEPQVDMKEMAQKLKDAWKSENAKILAYINEKNAPFEQQLSAMEKELSIAELQLDSAEASVKEREKQLKEMQDKAKKARTAYKLIGMLNGNASQQYKALDYIYRQRMEEYARWREQNIDKRGNLSDIAKDQPMYKQMKALYDKRNEARNAAEEDRIMRRGTMRERTDLYVEKLLKKRPELESAYQKALQDAKDNQDPAKAAEYAERLKEAQQALQENYQTEIDVKRRLNEEERKASAETYNLVKSLTKMTSATANAYKVNDMEAEKLRYRTWAKPVSWGGMPKRLDEQTRNEALGNKIIEWSKNLETVASKINEGTKDYAQFTTGVRVFDESVRRFATAISQSQLIDVMN